MTYAGWCASYKKGRVQSHYFLLLQQSCLSDACIIVTKPAYALSLGHSSRQSYKLFKVFKQPWIKDDNNHLASELSTKSAKLVSQGAASPRTQDTKHRANHSDAALFLSKHTHKHRANHSSAILLESKSERADLPNSVKNDSEH